MVFLIHAKEGMYGGLHGIEATEIIEAENLKEIHERATEMSIELMESYSAIYEELEAEVQEEINTNSTVNWTEEEIEYLRNEIYNNNVDYDFYKLDEEKIKDESWEELEEELYNDFEGFLAKYQERKENY